MVRLWKCLFWVGVVVVLGVIGLGVVKGASEDVGGYVVQTNFSTTFCSQYYLPDFYTITTRPSSLFSPPILTDIEQISLPPATAVVFPVTIGPKLRVTIVEFGMWTGLIVVILGFLWDAWHRKGMRWQRKQT